MLKERFFWTMLCLIAISWAINLYYAKSKQLEEPIFLDHYIETAIGDQITLYYVTNKDDRSSVNYIRAGDVEGFPQSDFFIIGDKPAPVDTFRHHELRSITFKLRNFEEGFETKSFNEIAVFYSDGRSSTASIGELVIHPEGKFEKDDQLTLEQVSGGGNSMGRVQYAFKANEPLKIQEITSPFSEQIMDQFIFSIKGYSNQLEKPFDELEFPFEVGKDKRIRIEMIPENPNYNFLYSFYVRLAGTTDEGKPFISYNHYNEPSFYLNVSQEDVNRIIAQKAGGVSVE